MITVALRTMIAAFVAAALLAAMPLQAQPTVNEPSLVPVPVYANDIPDRRYVAIGMVYADVRKPTVFSKPSSQAKIYRELWERAQKLGADAVINANYGKAHITALSWGSTTASGTAIRFTDRP